MPVPIRLTLDEAARAELARRFAATADAETRTRYQMVLLAAAGRAVAEIAPIVRRSPDTVQRVLRRYRAEGPGGVPRRPSPGQPPRAPVAWRAELERAAELDPHEVGVPSAVWTTGLLAAYLAEATGHRAAIDTVRVWLHRLGFVCKRPGWSLKRKATEQPAWAKNGSGWRRS
jgi:transposase